MELATALMSWVIAPIVKELAQQALAGQADLGAAFDRSLRVLGDQAAQKASDLLPSLLSRLSVRKRMQSKIAREPTLYDLAGLAWADEISILSDDALIIFTTNPRRFRSRLDAHWFSDILADCAAQHIGNIAQLATEDVAREEICKHLTNAIGEELNETVTEGSEAQASTLLASLLDQTQCKIRSFLIPDNATQQELTHALLRAAAADSAKILTYLDGTHDAKGATAVFSELAASALLSPKTDVFRRTTTRAGDIPLLVLENVFVEPSLRHQGKLVPAIAALASELTEPTGSLTVVAAPFGFGKSLTTRVLAAELAARWQNAPDKLPFPVLINAPDALAGRADSVEAIVREHLQKHAGASTPLTDWILDHAQISLILDSFDEVVLSRRAAKTWFHDLRQFCRPGLRSVMIASRPGAFEQSWIGENDSYYEIQPFNAEQVAEWLAKTANLIHDGTLTEESTRSRLGDLAGTPILLLMAAWAWSPAGSDKLLDKTALYEHFFQRIARGKWDQVQAAHPRIEEAARRLEQAAGQGAYQLALNLVAWEAARAEDDGSTQGLPVDRVRGFLQTRFGRNASGTTQGTLHETDIEEITRSLVLSLFFRPAAGDDTVVFSHRSFQEYLCGRYIASVTSGDPHPEAESSPSRIALGELRLGHEELTFATATIVAQGENAKRTALHCADTCYSDTRLRFLLEHRSYWRGTSEDGRYEMLACEPDSERGDTMRANAEIFGAMIRDFPPALLEAMGVPRRGAQGTSHRYRYYFRHGRRFRANIEAAHLRPLVPISGGMLMYKALTGEIWLDTVLKSDETIDESLLDRLRLPSEVFPPEGSWTEGLGRMNLVQLPRFRCFPLRTELDYLLPSLMEGRPSIDDLIEVGRLIYEHAPQGLEFSWPWFRCEDGRWRCVQIRSNRQISSADNLIFSMTEWIAAVGDMLLRWPEAGDFRPLTDTDDLEVDPETLRSCSEYERFIETKARCEAGYPVNDWESVFTNVRELGHQLIEALTKIQEEDEEDEAT